MRGHSSVILAPTGTVILLFKCFNDGSSNNSQEILFSVDNLSPEGTKDQSARSPIAIFKRDVHVSHSECNSKTTQRFDPLFGSEIEWKSDTVASLKYIIHYGDYDGNVDTYKIRSLISDWDSEDCMDTPSTLHTR